MSQTKSGPNPNNYIDDIFKSIGEFGSERLIYFVFLACRLFGNIFFYFSKGKYQFLVLVMIGLIASIGTISSYSTIFTDATPDFR